MTTAQAKVLTRQARNKPLTPEGNEEAKELYRKAIDEEDINYLPAYAELSYAWCRDLENDWGPRQTALEQAERRALEAVELSKDENKGWHKFFMGHWYLGIFRWHQGKFTESFQEYATARELVESKPDSEWYVKNLADLDADMAEALIYHGDPKRAVQLVLDAMDRNKDHAYWYHWIKARGDYHLGRYQDAIDEIGKIVPQEKQPNDVRLILAASKAQLATTEADVGKAEKMLSEAKAIMEEFSKIEPNWTLAKSAAYEYGSATERDHWITGLDKAGLKHSVNDNP
ncbi:hypothetical protein [Phyllobacterium bourgognense]|uniref:Tetratricopeptide repeat protein n=1 Tax=Phyllobacterium bourgognense TaxID=314236 RepID=A0A368YC72_9HYPH|nr:hypothetical protein [Phyllobacterium bourgognense]RCW77715.1 hypothetical protein C7476_13922 [Phyllobacterium bourgognense]